MKIFLLLCVLSFIFCIEDPWKEIEKAEKGEAVNPKTKQGFMKRSKKAVKKAARKVKEFFTGKKKKGLEVANETESQVESSTKKKSGNIVSDDRKTIILRIRLAKKVEDYSHNELAEAINREIQSMGPASSEKKTVKEKLQDLNELLPKVIPML